MALKKINIGLIMDRMFRRTFFLRPLPDKSLEAIDITGGDEQYIKDKTGATNIDPSCIVRVRGIKRIDYMAFKLSGATNLLNLFNTQKLVVTPPNIKIEAKTLGLQHQPIPVTIPEETVKCLHCEQENKIPERTIEVPVPDSTITIGEHEIAVPSVEVDAPAEQTMSEKTFGDMLNYAEIAGRMQAENNPEADKKQNYILILALGAVIIGIFIYFKIKSNGG